MVVLQSIINFLMDSGSPLYVKGGAQGTSAIYVMTYSESDCWICVADNGKVSTYIPSIMAPFDYRRLSKVIAEVHS